MLGGMSTVAREISARDIGGLFIKVNHAGEHGAVNIYAGQIFMARLTAPDLISELSEFKRHEERHRSIFNAELQRRSRRRCRSYVLCGIGGRVLGLITGLLGRGAIAATTVAVERVVLKHLKHQVQSLGSSDPEAVAAITAIINDEQEHHDSSAQQVRAGQFWPRILTPVVSASTEVVIWLGMRA
jgi:3-demethoxyubiquinol 3-hydroxylase